MRKVLAVIRKQGDRLLRIKPKILDNDKDEKFEQRLGVLGVRAIVNLIDVDFG